MTYQSFTFVAIMCFCGTSIVVTASPPADGVNLGTAGDFVILTKTGVSTTGVTAIVGDVGASPISVAAITGFNLQLNSTFATTSFVTGKVYAASLTAPTPSKLTTAVSDMQTAFSAAAGRAPTEVAELGAGNIQGMKLAPGVYKWSSSVHFTDSLELEGNNASSVWIFQIAQDLTVGNGAILTLSGGALACNIYWQVSGSVLLGTTSQMHGVILSQTHIVIQTGATLTGLALAQTAVTLDANQITRCDVVVPSALKSGGSTSAVDAPHAAESSSTLSSGAIVGIVLGCLAVLVLGVVAVVKSNRKEKTPTIQTAPKEEAALKAVEAV
jgi:hypothetical protein